MNKLNSFMELYKSGEIELDKLDDYIDFWHDSEEDNGELYQFLGFKESEKFIFDKWCLKGDRVLKLYKKRFFDASNMNKTNQYGGTSVYVHELPIGKSVYVCNGFFRITRFEDENGKSYVTIGDDIKHYINKIVDIDISDLSINDIKKDLFVFESDYIHYANQSVMKKLNNLTSSLLRSKLISVEEQLELIEKIENKILELNDLKELLKNIID